MKRSSISRSTRTCSALVAALCTAQAARAETPATPSQNVAQPNSLDLTKLAELQVVWSHNTHGTQPLRLGNLLMVIEPNQHEVAALDAQKGEVRWRVFAPKGVTFASLHGRDADALWVSGYNDANKFFVARLSYTATGGKLAWTQLSDDLGDLELPDVGTDLGLRSRARCVLQVVDGSSGRLLPQMAHGHHIERWAKDGPMHSSCEVTTQLHLVQRPQNYVITSDFGKARDGLSALDAKNATAWKVPGRYFRLLHADRETAVFNSYSAADDNSRLIRVRLSNGQILWQSELKSSCESDGNSRHAQILRPKSGPAVVLIQDCEKARLVELLTGIKRWEKPHTATLSVLAEAEPVDLGKDGGDSFMVDSSGRELSVRFLRENGEAIGSAKLPRDTREVTLVPGGVVGNNQALDQVYFLRHDGSVGWQAGGHFGNAFRKDDHFIILPSSTPTIQVMVELQSGRMHKLNYDSPFVLGRVPSATPNTLWLTTRRNPESIVAVRTP